MQGRIYRMTAGGFFIESTLLQRFMCVCPEFGDPYLSPVKPLFFLFYLLTERYIFCAFPEKAQRNFTQSPPFLLKEIQQIESTNRN